MIRYLFKSCLVLIVFGSAALCVTGVVQSHLTHSIRAVTMADAIRMTRLADPDYIDGAPSLDRVAQFSRDGKQFVVVVRHGNLENNTNEYDLLFWTTERIGDPSFPRHLMTMSSSSNRPAIEQVEWLEDNQTIVFLGEQPGQLHALYSFKTSDRELKRITGQPTNLISYSITPDGKEIAFLAQAPKRTLFDQCAQRYGLLVRTQSLVDLIEASTDGEARLWFQSGLGPSRELSVPDTNSFGSAPVLSADGRYIAIRATVASFPEDWKEYRDPVLKSYTGPKISAGQQTWLSRYALVNTQTGESRFLLNSPVRAIDSLITWAPDSKSVAIAGLYLPLENTRGEERKLRQSKTFAAEVDVAHGLVTKIAQEDQITPTFTHDYKRSLFWDRQTGCLIFGFSSVYPAPELKPKVEYCKSDGKWKIVNVVSAKPNHAQIILQEGMNSRPRIIAIDEQSHRRSMLLDLNPDFATVQFGRVEEVRWKGPDGHFVKGGLYLPVGYEVGKRYPVVIQTHLWTRERFWIDGPWSTAFAAQPLAGKGIMVLQADESEENFGKFQEISREAGVFDRAIDYLDAKGLIDPQRVGITGFSRTCLFVEYALTHSNHSFRAAAIADGVDDGYFQYLMFANSSPVLTQYSEWANGGRPFGKGIDSWKQRASGFNLEKVRAPVRIMARNSESLLLEWEWFAGLTLLHKPVEMVYLNDGSHNLQKPWDRMISQQGNVDWFTFWLKGEEDPDPSKAEQYTRWRQMRDQVYTRPGRSY